VANGWYSLLDLFRQGRWFYRCVRTSLTISAISFSPALVEIRTSVAPTTICRVCVESASTSVGGDVVCLSVLFFFLVFFLPADNYWFSPEKATANGIVIRRPPISTQAQHDFEICALTFSATYCNQGDLGSQVLPMGHPTLRSFIPARCSIRPPMSLPARHEVLYLEHYNS